MSKVRTPPPDRVTRSEGMGARRIVKSMRERNQPVSVTSARRGLAESQSIRRRRYFWIMGVCLTLIVSAWCVVRFFSIGAAVAMSVVAMVLPPIAAIVANRPTE